MKSRPSTSLMLALVLFLTLGNTACTTANNNQNMKKNAGVGAAAGAVVGALAGYAVDHKGGALKGALLGAAAGGAIGAGVGHYMDKQQEAFEQQLAQERAAHQVEIERTQNEMLKLTMNDEVSFDTGSATIKSAFHPTLNKVADVMQKFSKTHMRVVGHTDNTGRPDYNQRLSERRAAAVGAYLRQHGVDRERITTEGRGKDEPRASNATAEGRAANRRVEILIAPDPDAGDNG